MSNNSTPPPLTHSHPQTGYQCFEKTFREQNLWFYLLTLLTRINIVITQQNYPQVGERTRTIGQQMHAGNFSEHTACFHFDINVLFWDTEESISLLVTKKHPKTLPFYKKKKNTLNIQYMVYGLSSVLIIGYVQLYQLPRCRISKMKSEFSASVEIR